MPEDLPGAVPRASDSVATFRNVDGQANQPFAEFRAPRLAPTYDGEAIAELCNDGNRTDAIVAESRKWLPALANALWKPKPSITVHDLIGGDIVASLRTCYAWCAGANEPFAFILIKLLRSEQGWRVLEYLMRGCRQPWWLDLVRARECSQAYESRRNQLNLDLR